MSGPCSSYAIAGDESSGPCPHPAGYQDSGSADWCACHYGEPYDPAECQQPAGVAIAEARKLIGGYILQMTQDHETPDPDVVTADDVLSRVPQDVQRLATTRDAFVASLGSALGWHWEEAPGVPSAEDVLAGIHDALREEGLLVPADQVRADTLDEAARMLRGEFVPLTNRQPDWRNAERELVTAARTYRQRVPS